MKAAVRRKYCKPSEIVIEEINMPLPKEDEILVRIDSTTVNRTDCGVLTGDPFIMRFFVGLPNPRQITPGTDFAGTVEALGSSVDKFAVGDRVFGFRDEGLATHAEYATIPMKRAVAKIPDGVSFHEAVASLEAPHYAYNFMKNAKVTPSSKVLVNGASGGIGSSLVQLLKVIGAEVTAVCDTKNIENIKARGADRVIDYLVDDFTEIDDQFDFVCDAVGKSTFGKCKRLLKPKGVYCSSEFGPMLQNIPLAIFSPLFRGRKLIFPIPTDVHGSLKYMSGLLEQKKFKPLIEKVYPLDQIAEAYTYVDAGLKSGNVILQMPTHS